PSKLGLPSLNRNFENWPPAEVAHARQTPSKLGLPSLNRNFEDCTFGAARAESSLLELCRVATKISEAK
ncbi:MAG: hypothetical protein IKQ77_07550, partial [Prevotella sp.]|nr:hypothetical protein [Prevotella sp.]